MDEDTALALARQLSAEGVDCRLRRIGQARTLVVALDEDREAVWDRHRDVLEARVLRRGALIGFVPLPVPEWAPTATIAELLRQQRYEQLYARSARAPRSPSPARRRESAAPRSGRRPTLVGRAAGSRTGRAAVLLLAVIVVLLVLYLVSGRP